MAKKTALITGISGQDGAYLAEFLLKKKYRIIGTDRRSARGNNWRLNRLGIINKMKYIIWLRNLLWEPPLILH